MVSIKKQSKNNAKPAFNFNQKKTIVPLSSDFASMLISGAKLIENTNVTNFKNQLLEFKAKLLNLKNLL